MRALPVTMCLTAALTLVAALAPGAAAPGPSPEHGRTVITGEQLREAGLTRLSDILLMVDDWAVSTTDGYTWKVSPGGLSAYQDQHWIVMLDGQRVDLRLFDAVNLNLLPVSFDQIDSVVVVNTPELYRGEFAGKGLIHFFTRVPQHGKTYDAMVVGGGRSGDPGPYSYTRHKTANVDLTGPDGSLTFGLAWDNWRLSANALIQHHFFTEPAIRPRTLGILGIDSTAALRTLPVNPSSAAGISRIFDTGSDDTWPGMLRYGTSIGLCYDNGSSRHQPFFGYSKAQKYFYYGEPFGREIPADNTYLHLGINGEISLASNTEFCYRVHYSSNNLSMHSNRLGFNYDWKNRRVRTNAEVTRQGSAIGGTFGAGLDEAWIATGYLLEAEEQYTGRVYGSMRISLSDNNTHRLGAMAKFAGAAPSLKIFWNNAYDWYRKYALDIKLSFIQRDFAENEDLWYWTTKGYLVLEDNGIDYTLPDEINKSNTATADVTWRIRFKNQYSIGVSGLFRYFSDLYVEHRRFSLNPVDCGLTSATNVISGVEGQTAGGRIQMSFRPSPALRGSLYYRYLTVVSGDGTFKEAWQTVPEHKAAARLSYRPYDDLSFWAMLTYLSSTSWKAYQSAEGLVCYPGDNSVTYSSQIGRSTIIDFKIRKHLLGHQLAADLICRNVWDRPRRYHPVGASFDLSFFFALDFTFHSR